MVKSVMDSEK